MRFRTAAWLAVCAAVLVGGAWYWTGGKLAELPNRIRQLATESTASKGRESRQARPVAVEATKARADTATSDIEAVGGLRADEAVTITPEIAGRIAEINFKEGERVEKGDVLVKLDDSLVRAELADAQARFDLASANNDRARQLSRTGNVTERAIDEAASNFGIAEAAVELQKVRLAKHTIRAPFPGRVGLRGVSVGSYIGIGTPIVALAKIDVLKVDFKLPERFVSSVTLGQTVEIMVDAVPGKSFVGEIYAIDPQVDVNGRALSLRARLQNRDGQLRPGLFARIVVKGKQTREVVMAPEGAIVPRGGDTFVYRIENGKAVEAKVKLGERRGGEVELVEGVLPNTMIVTAGQLKLRNGAPVEIVNTAASAEPRKEGT